MEESTVYLVFTIIFAAGAVIAAFIGKLRHGETKYVASVTVFLALFLATVAYAGFYSKGDLYTRFDGNEVHAIRFAFEALAAALIVAGLTRCAAHAHYEVILVSITTLFWGVLLFLGSNAKTEGGIIAAFVFAAILAAYSLYLIWYGSFVQSTFYMVSRWLYVIYVVVLFLGFMLCQPGFAVIGVLGTSIWFGVTDFFLCAVVGAAVIFCPECCGPLPGKGCCSTCKRPHAYGSPCVPCNKCHSYHAFTTPCHTPVQQFSHHHHHQHPHSWNT